MDKLRIVLVTAFSLVSFMILIEFTQFRDLKNKSLLEARELSSSQSATLTTTPLPALTISDDIPSAIENTTNQPDKITKQVGLITVETDALSIVINPKGGDIIYVALKKFLARKDTPAKSFTLLEENEHRTYIAQSGLIGKNGTDVDNERPLFNASDTSFALIENKDKLIVDLNLQKNKTTITKRFTFYRDNYLFDVDYIINNQSTENWEASYFAQIKRDDSKDTSAEEANMGMAPYLGFATKTETERFKKIDFADLESTPFNQKIKNGWIALIQHYFLSAWIPDKNIDYEYSTIKSKAGFNLARIKGPIIIVEAGKSGTIHSTFYAGPKNQYKLSKISEGLDLSVDYGVLWMLAQPLYDLMYFFNIGELHLFGLDLKLVSGVNNWGFSIILLTLFVKLLLFPLNAKAYSSMAKMRLIQPKMLEIKDRFAEDKQKQSKEMMDLYKNEGVNPLGGCLPMFIQMPVFMALYWVLLESVELRHAPFIGYINDLSAMDPYFIMPIIMGVTMYIQQQLNPPPPDPMQAKIMQFLPIIFTFFFLFFPAGLVLYWIVNNILSIAQQWYITKKLEEVKTK